MSCLYYQGNELYIENVALKTIAEKYGTPCYVYSRAAIEKNWLAFDQAFDAISHHISYAVKANSNLAILNVLTKIGSWFDIVSIGELKRVMAAGGDPKRIVFSGVGKKETEIEEAISQGIYCFNVESEAELKRIHAIALRLKTVVNIAFRVNPNVDANTHSYISTGLKENKFGIDIEEILPLCEQLPLLPAVKLIGLACHIGSQILDLEPFKIALSRLLALFDKVEAQRITLEHLNIGGGLGITYKDENPPTVVEYADLIQKKLAGRKINLILEPGRAIVGNAGTLLTQVEYLKQTGQHHFAIVDAGMNDLLRPALYQAWQNILPLTLHSHPKTSYDVVGPVCESADVLGKNRQLALLEKDFLAIDSAGAYGFSMSSNYNARTKPAEILVSGDHTYVIRRRETFEEMYAAENLVD